jgi:pyruvate dehydrogenase E2 component (dihydrolipoamide acetyltransferase)
VRKRALELDVDLSLVPPSSPDGRVLLKDVEAFAVDRASAPAEPAKTAGQNGHAARVVKPPEADQVETPVSPLAELGKPAVKEVSRPAPTGTEERKPLAGLRRRIAERMELSWRTIPHCTAFDEVDGTELVVLRERLKAGAEKRGARLTYLPLIVKAVVRVLKQHPMFNASLDEQTREVIYKYSYHIGLATATPDGLLVPVVRDADKLDLVTLASEINRLSEGGRNRTLKPQELSGSTFTITNVGSYGGMSGTAIINPPEAAILAVGKLQERVVVRDGQYVTRNIMPLSLSFDHRLIDGAEAGAFTASLKELLENPSLLLLEAI